MLEILAGTAGSNAGGVGIVIFVAIILVFAGSGGGRDR